MKWHYTIGQHFVGILQDGEIRPSSFGIPVSQRPIVWFSTEPEWEPTATHTWLNPDGSIVHLNRARTAELGGGLVRIGVADETAPYDWSDLQELSEMPKEMAQVLQRMAINKGASPLNWWGTFDSVPRSKWIAVEVHSNNVWVDVPVRKLSKPTPEKTKLPDPDS